MRRRLGISLAAITVLILVVFAIPLASFISNVERERLLTSLERDAFIIAGHAKETLNPSQGAVLPSLQPYIDDHSSGDARVIVTNQEGVAVATNDAAVELGASFLNRPEVGEALTGSPAVGERTSQTLGETLVYVAVPIFLGEDVLGVVRISHPKSLIDEAVQDRLTGIAFAGLITLVAAIFVSIPIALGLARPIERLTRRTEKLTEGDFSVRADEGDGPAEVRNLARAFNTMASRLGLLLEGQRQFAGAVSHQMRTPLTALSLRLEQAQALAQEDSRDLVDAIDASRVEVDRLHAMVEQLLSLARLEGRASSLVNVDVNAVLESRVDLWTPLCQERNISFRVDSPDPVVCVALDGAVEQIVDNYIDNALSVVPDNSTITVQVTILGDKVAIDVEDEGPGLSSDELTLAFERFWRGRHAENSPGSGLGLAIVKQLAVASGGEALLMHRTDGASGVVARLLLRKT